MRVRTNIGRRHLREDEFRVVETVCQHVALVVRIIERNDIA
jgi:hypothetical protein